MLSFFSRDVLDEILNLTESVSEGFPTYSRRQQAFLYNTKNISQDDTTDCLNRTIKPTNTFFSNNTSRYKPNNSTLVKEMKTKSDLQLIFI